jgi:hypothetical protein
MILGRAVMLAGVAMVFCRAVAASAATESSLAARYPGDVGLARDPAVLFADDFESGDLKRWDELRGAPVIVTQRPQAGRACVEMEMIKGRNTGCDAKKWFLPGADTVHARFYVRFSANYQYSHHFVTLLANRRQNKWSAFGQAGRKPTGADYFSSGMEPWFAWGANPPPGEINLYTYFMDMARDPKMDKYWGNGFFPPGPGKGRAGGDAKVVPALDRWQCWEFMVQANSAPGVADGRQAMWLDGKLVGDFRGIRWRDDPQLAINCLWLQHYGFDGGDPTKQHWPERQSVWFDDVVVARSYVGPMVGK